MVRLSRRPVFRIGAVETIRILWQVLIDFYHREQLDTIAGTPDDGLHPVDSRIFRLSKAAGVNLTPLIHTWGVHPEDWPALQQPYEWLHFYHHYWSGRLDSLVDYVKNQGDKQ